MVIRYDILEKGRLSIMSKSKSKKIVYAILGTFFFFIISQGLLLFLTSSLLPLKDNIETLLLLWSPSPFILFSLYVYTRHAIERISKSEGVHKLLWFIRFSSLSSWSYLVPWLLYNNGHFDGNMYLVVVSALIVVIAVTAMTSMIHHVQSQDNVGEPLEKFLFSLGKNLLSHPLSLLCFFLFLFLCETLCLSFALAMHDNKERQRDGCDKAGLLYEKMAFTNEKEGSTVSPENIQGNGSDGIATGGTAGSASGTQTKPAGGPSNPPVTPGPIPSAKNVMCECVLEFHFKSFESNLVYGSTDYHSISASNDPSFQDAIKDPQCVKKFFSSTAFLNVRACDPSNLTYDCLKNWNTMSLVLIRKMLDSIKTDVIHIDIVAHADDTPISGQALTYRSNYELSSARMNSAQSLLTTILYRDIEYQMSPNWNPKAVANEDDFLKNPHPPTGARIVEVRIKRASSHFQKNVLEETELLCKKTDSIFNSIQITNQKMTLLDYIYFTVYTITTTGYGDIIPITPRAKLIVSLANFYEVIFIVIFFNIMVSCFKSKKVDDPNDDNGSPKPKPKRKKKKDIDPHEADDKAAEKKSSGPQGSEPGGPSAPPPPSI